jgi:hypothetical protein
MSLDSLWATFQVSVSSGYDAEFHDWQFGFFRLQVDIHEGHGTIGERHGMCELERHATAVARHGIGELAFTVTDGGTLNQPCFTA